MSKDNVTHFPDKKLQAANRLKFDLQQLANVLPMIAEARKAAFDAHIKAGFTEQQALELVKGLF